MEKIYSMMDQARAYYKSGDIQGLRSVRGLVSDEYSKKETEAITVGFDEVMAIYELEQESMMELDTMLTKLDIKLQMARR